MFTTLLTVEAVLAGLQACGVDSARIRRGLALPHGADMSELVSYSIWDKIWSGARQADSRPELPTLVGLNVPYGQFGTIDYLSGSAETVNGGLQSLIDHFSVASAVRALELEQLAEVNRLRIINVMAKDHEVDEFTTAAIFGRLRYTTQGAFGAQQVYLTRANLLDAPHALAFNSPVLYGATHAGFDYSIEAGEFAPSTKDPRLHATLLELAGRLGLKSDKGTAVEIAVRARLRNLLPRAQATAERVARSMGVSERTLTRRLAELGTSYHEILDKFRMEESERLLLQGKLELAEIALSLGFSDQASWSRAFRRIHKTSPAAWIGKRSDRSS